MIEIATELEALEQRAAVKDGMDARLLSYVLRGARVLDPSLELDGTSDIIIGGGRIVALGADLPAPPDALEVDLQGAIVSPGWIDIHTHVAHGFASVGIDSDRCGIRAGVTLVADAGSTGTSNFGGLLLAARRSKTNIRVLLNLSRIGLVGLARTRSESIGELEMLQLADPAGIIRLIDEHPIAIGIKLRLGHEVVGDNGRLALWMATKAARESGSRVMVHVGGPGMAIVDVVQELSPSDILTHVYTPNPGGTNGDSAILRDVFARRDEVGFTIDVGHGRKSLSFDIASSAISAGLIPDTISSDAAAYSVDGPVFNLPTTMTKFLALGMSLEDTVRAVTGNAARALGLDDYGSLAIGAPASLSIFSIERGQRRLFDAVGKELTVANWFRPLGCFVDGLPYAAQV